MCENRAAQILDQIRRLSSPIFKQQMEKRFGINTEYALGTPVTQLRALVKPFQKPDQPLADALWKTGIHEARITASMFADPLRMTRTHLNSWVRVLNSWDICDACANNVFSKTKEPLILARTWIAQKEEFTRRAGFATLAMLALPRAVIADTQLRAQLPLIKKHAADPRPMVYKAVNWALRNIGKKNPRLTPHAQQCAREILDLYPQNRTARWVALDTLRELANPKIRLMIAKRK